jgi:hypothetical protein
VFSVAEKAIQKLWMDFDRYNPHSMEIIRRIAPTSTTSYYLKAPSRLRITLYNRSIGRNKDGVQRLLLIAPDMA